MRVVDSVETVRGSVGAMKQIHNFNSSVVLTQGFGNLSCLWGTQPAEILRFQWLPSHISNHGDESADASDPAVHTKHSSALFDRSVEARCKFWNTRIRYHFHNGVTVVVHGGRLRDTWQPG